MKKYFIYFGLITVTFFLWLGCDPTKLEKSDLGQLAGDDEVTFSISTGADVYRFTFTNTSQVEGLAKWDFGNGSTAEGNQVTGYYPLEGTYTVSLTLYTKAGAIIVTKEHFTTETDLSYFTDPDLIKLCGGSEALDGRTWVIDSLSTGHLGVGPAGSNGLSWWGAAALEKTGMNLYDDNINFNLSKFKATYTNHGKSYVKGFRTSDSNYTNVTNPGSDCTVDFTPVPGKWQFRKEDTKMYLTLTCEKPLFPCFDVGATNGQYEILSLTDNVLELVATGSDGNAWHIQLIKQGYVKPALKFNLVFTATAETNAYLFSLTDVEIPSGWNVTNITWKFGDGMEQSETDISKVVTHTYMRKGPYNVSVEVTTSVEPVIKSTVISVLQNHPNYVPYLLNLMVMYQDFGEVSLVPMKFDVSDGGGSIVTVSNPDASKYPNLSSKVGLYSKINAQYANAYLQLPAGYRFALTLQSTFRLLVYGTAGDKVLLKLENTDRTLAWQTAAELIYTIQATNTWEAVSYDFKGVSAGFDYTGDIYTSDITSDSRFNSDFYNIIRIMYNAGDNKKSYSFYFDDLAGPHIEGL